MSGKRPSVVNKKAKFEFKFIETFVAGVVLKGTEVKSLREGKVTLGEAYCYFKNNELFIKDLHITPYAQGNLHNVDPRRDRKLLLKKKELEKLKKKSEQKGLTIIPVKLFFNERNFVKIEIALAQGKKLYDKRHDIKTKDIKRDLERLD